MKKCRKKTEFRKLKEKKYSMKKLVKDYPESNRRIPLEISAYGIDNEENNKCYSVHLSPHGIEFSSSSDYSQGTLLRINVFLPDFWQRKRKLVDYHRVETPEHFRILAKVISSDVVSRKGKKKLILAQTANIDEIDAMGAYLLPPRGVKTTHAS